MDKPWKAFLFGVLMGLILAFTLTPLLINQACPTPLCVDDARLVPVTDRGYYLAAHKLLSHSRESIHIVSFELKYYDNYPDSKMNQLVRDLIEAHERGVDVKIIVDQYSENNNAFHKLDEAGVPWRFDSNSTTTHAKLIVVDGKIVLLGSTNLSYYGLEKNNEANILIEDEKTAGYYEEYFQKIWSAG